MDPERLDGLVALVTGSTKGIGEAIAHRLAAEGASVAVNGRKQQDAEDVAEAIRGEGGEAVGVGADVSQVSEVQKLFDRTREAFGPVDVVVANAGVSHTGAIYDIDVETWDRLMAVNARGMFLTLKQAADRMIQRKEGKIITIGSDAAFEGMKYHLPYSASKFAVRGLTQGLAKELGEHGINVNCICPGIIDTDMWHEVSDPGLARYLGLEEGEAFEKFADTAALGRPGQPEDIAPVAAFLASEEADFITGASIPVGGGTSFT